MLGTDKVKQYFSTGTSHYVTPSLSAEWNYNLFYPPYATFAGVGQKAINISGTWAPIAATTALGKYGQNTAKKFTVSNDTHGSSKITVLPVSPDTTFGAKTYKIVFYAKVVEDVEVSLTSLVYVDSNRTHSASHTIDSVQWVKFETYVSSVPTASAYNSFSWTLDYTSTDGSKSYSILIDMVEMYETSAMEYQYGNLWPTKDPFTFGRPGESYVPSGSSKTTLPANFRIASIPDTATTNISKSMPCSPVVYYPDLVIGVKDYIYKSRILSDTNEYKYFVSDGTNNVLGAKYEKVFYTNKLVLKFNVAFSKPAFTVSIYNGATKYTDVLIPVTSVPDSGVVVLYLQTNGTWSTTPWDTMPTFDNDGEITNSIAMDKIIVTQTAATVGTGYTNKAALTAKMQRLQVVEISPRLELDLTNFTMSVDVQCELDNKQNPLPISAISSNNATIKLSNIPLKVSAGLLSLFSNNSTNSKLKGLFKKNVKFYFNYIIRDNIIGATAQDKVIPGGVFYSEEWIGQDIGSTSISAFDVTKQLQIKSPTDYVSVSQTPFKIITTLLDMAGFTDYDYDSLYKVTTSVKQPIKTSFFFADGKKQKVFEVLKDIFEVYQIGAYINAYGVMKFLNLETILKNTTPNMALHDSEKSDSSTVPGLTIDSNILQDTYTETVKTKVGKATIKYKTPHVSKSLSTNETRYDLPGSTNLIDKNDIITNFEQDQIITNHYLHKSIESESQNYFHLDPAVLRSQFGAFDVDHEAYGVIEGEVVSFRDKEYQFTTDPGASGTPSTTPSKTYIITNKNDLFAAKTEYDNLAGYGQGVTFYPTGKICNVERGLFNTPVKKHTIINTDALLKTRIEDTDGDTGKIKIVPGGAFKVASPNEGSNTIAFIKDAENISMYNTFSTKMAIGYRSENAFYDKVMAGLVLETQSHYFYVWIEAVGTESTAKEFEWKNQKLKPVNIKPTKYLLNVAEGGNSVLKSKVDITGLLKDDLLNFPSNDPYEEYSRLVNLKLVRLESGKFEIYLNKNKVGIKIKDDFVLGEILNFGVTVYSDQTATGGIDFTEVYATKMRLDTKDIYYHFETKPFLNAIASNHKFFDVNYMLQVVPRVVGLKIYDAQYQLAPSINAYPFKAEYTWLNWSYDSKGKAVSRFTDIHENYLSYSDVQHTGFRGRVAVINSTTQGVWLSITASATNTAENKFAIKTNNLIALGEEVSISKVFDESNLSESIEISSNWVQSRGAAIGILNHVFKTIDGFSRDTRVSVYGNPLFEIGDVVKVTYSLKNIKDQIYFVQGVQQIFATGIQTILTLNQIGLQADSSGNTSIQTPAAGSTIPVAAPAAPTNLSVSTLGGIATLTWTAPSNPGSSPVDNYRVSVSPFPSGVSAPVPTNSTSTTLQIPGAQTGVAYTYQVSAHNAAGWGQNSTSVKAIPEMAFDASIPEPNNVGQNGNTLSWGNTTGFSTIIRTSSTNIATVTGNSYTFTGMNPGNYTIFLTATNGTFIGNARAANIQIYSS